MDRLPWTAHRSATRRGLPNGSGFGWYRAGDCASADEFAFRRALVFEARIVAVATQEYNMFDSHRSETTLAAQARFYETPLGHKLESCSEEAAQATAVRLFHTVAE